MLLNCGASTHVASLAPASCQFTRYIIIDSHRPIHPRYNDPADHECLLVLSDDDPLPAQDIPLANEDLDNMPAEGEQSRDEVSRLWTKAKCLWSSHSGHELEWGSLVTFTLPSAAVAIRSLHALTPAFKTCLNG